VERRHDEEVENAILENCSQQTSHAGLAVVSFELEDEGDNANKGDEVCRSMRFLDIREMIGNVYRRARPATCRPTCHLQEQ